MQINIYQKGDMNLKEIKETYEKVLREEREGRNETILLSHKENEVKKFRYSQAHL